LGKRLFHLQILQIQGCRQVVVMSDAANGATLGRGEVIVMESVVSQPIDGVTGSDFPLHIPGTHRVKKSTKELVGAMPVFEGFTEILLVNRPAEL
jgi:hypothetical protein